MLPEWMTNFPLRVTWQGCISGRAYFCENCPAPKSGTEYRWSAGAGCGDHYLMVGNKGPDGTPEGAKCPSCGYEFQDGDMGEEVYLSVLEIVMDPTAKQMIEDGKKPCKHNNPKRDCTLCLQEEMAEYEREWLERQ